MASADFTINGSATPVSVTGGAGVTLALVSIVGVGVIEWTFLGRSLSTQSVPTITLSGSPRGATASFTMPLADAEGGGYTSALGVSFVVQCRINSGRDSNGTVVPGYTKTGIVGVKNVLGLLPFSLFETFERNAITGIADDLNSALSQIP
jgi:hypothetical protein